MRPQLTISLLASNHIHAVRRCLDSLVPILMRIPSELIVVDTSGNDQFRELACQYTDHVVPFRWCDDFSKARNAGLKEAHGEWFMFIDDDEWLDETEEIITFFSSGEYMGYKSGTYMVRNYTNWPGTEYVDAYVARMVCLTPETRFVNTIHEYITPYKGPVKQFSIYAHHYGYVKNGNADIKTLRNVPLLEKEMEKKAYTAHNYLQFCQEYLSDYQYEKAEAYAWKCLELEGEDIEKEKSWCLAHLPYLISRQGDYQRALETGKQMLRHPLCSELASLRVYQYLMAACEKLGGHDKDIIVYAKGYHGGIQCLDARPEEWFRQSMGALGEQQAKTVENTIYMSGLQAAIRMKDEKSVNTFLKWFPWGTDEIEKLYKSFYALVRDRGNGDFFQEQLARSGIEDRFVFLIKAQAGWKDGNLEAAQKFHKAAAASNNAVVLQEAVLLSFQSMGKVSLEPLMGCVDVTQWPYISEYIASQAEMDELADWIKIAEGYLGRFPVQALSLLTALQERLLIEGVSQVSDRELLPMMERYCEWVLQYGALVYSDQMRTPEGASLMPKKYRFSLQMEQVFRDLENVDLQGVLQGLYRAIGICPSLCGVIRRMLPVIEEEMEKAGRPNEFETLGAQVKQMVRDLIQEGRLIDAMPLIEQLSSVMPRDLEVLRLRQKLYSDIK